MPMHDDVMTRAMYEFLPGGGEWMTTPPTEPGWYWVRHVMFNRRKKSAYLACIVQYLKRGRRVELLDEFPIWRVITHWLGPLPVPAPPVFAVSET